MELTPEIEHILSLIDQAIEHKYLRVEQIRRLAGTEENYRIIFERLIESNRNFSMPVLITQRQR